MNSPPRSISQADWVEFLSSLPFTHAVTLKPNYMNIMMSGEKLRSAFEIFHRDIDRRLLGPRFNTARHAKNRATAVGIIEGLPFSGHIHALFGIQPHNWNKFEALFRPYHNSISSNPITLNPWSHRISGGTTQCERLRDIEGWVSYACKGLTDRNASDKIMFLPK